MSGDLKMLTTVDMESQNESKHNTSYLSFQILTAQSYTDKVKKTIIVTGPVTNKKVYTRPKLSLKL